MVQDAVEFDDNKTWTLGTGERARGEIIRRDKKWQRQGHAKPSRKEDDQKQRAADSLEMAGMIGICAPVECQGRVSALVTFSHRMLERCYHSRYMKRRAPCLQMSCTP